MFISLPSRDIIADSIESVGSSQEFTNILTHMIAFIGRNGERMLSLFLVPDDPHTNLLQAQHYDGNISIPGCDKNMPGCVLAAARHNRPTIIVYGGTIQPGTRHVGRNIFTLNLILAMLMGVS